VILLKGVTWREKGGNAPSEIFDIPKNNFSQRVEEGQLKKIG